MNPERTKSKMISIEQYNKAVDLYADNLYRFALKITNNVDDAKDLVQDAFEKLWENRKNVNPDKIKSYLFTIVYHKFIDNYRKNKKVDYLEDNPVNPSYWVEYNNTMDIINKALNKLPEIQKTLILLRDWEGYSYKEIQEITGLSESQVKVYIFRARKTLRKILKSYELLI